MIQRFRLSKDVVPKHHVMVMVVDRQPQMCELLQMYPLNELKGEESLEQTKKQLMFDGFLWENV